MTDMSKETKQNIKTLFVTLGIVFGWLILLAFLPYLAMFLFFLPMITGNDRDRIRRMNEEREEEQRLLEEQRRQRIKGEAELEAEERRSLQLRQESVRRGLRIINGK